MIVRRIDEAHPGAPKTVTKEDKVTKGHDLVLVDRRLKVRKTVNISKQRVNYIPHEKLGLKELSRL